MENLKITFDHHYKLEWTCQRKLFCLHHHRRHHRTAFNSIDHHMAKFLYWWRSVFHDRNAPKPTQIPHHTNYLLLVFLTRQKIGRGNCDNRLYSLSQQLMGVAPNLTLPIPILEIYTQTPSSVQFCDTC